VLAVRPNIDTTHDPTLYHLMGVNLADGLGLVRPAPTPGAALLPTAEFGPVMPGLVAFATKLGVRSADGQALFTAVLGALTIVVVGLLGRRVAGARVGLVAAAIVAFHPLLVQIDGALASESPYLLLVALMLLTTIWACDAPSLRRWFVVGLVAGLAALTRAEALALLALLVVPAAAIRAWPGWRRSLVAAVVPLLAASVLIVPWTIRNWDTFHRFVPVSNNTGSVVLGANCPSTYEFGPRQGGWDFGCVATYAGEHPKQSFVTRSENEAVVYSGWRDAGVRYALDHPGPFLASLPSRIARTWGVYWYPRDQIFYDQRDGRDYTLQAIGFVVAFVLLVLAACGIRPLLRRLRGQRWVALVLAAPVVLTVLTAVVTYGSTRFRVIAEPTIAILAAVTIVSFADRRRGRAASGDVHTQVDETIADGRVDPPLLDLPG
jgi:hypothetical protein